MHRSASLSLAMLVGALLAGLPGLVSAQSLSVDEIVHRSNRATHYPGRDRRVQVDMTATDSQGRTRERSLILLRRDDAESDALENSAYLADQKYYLFFKRPADANRTVFLVWKHLRGEDDRWFYLPALDLVKRISASDRRTSFMGTDFFYEDVSGRGIHEDVHELVETTDSYYVVKSIPKDPDTIEFSRFTTFVHKETFLPVRIDYFDKSGNLYRVYRVQKVETIQGYPTIIEASMETLQAGSRTVIIYSAIRYDNGLPEDIFTERYLRRPPIRHLR